MSKKTTLTDDLKIDVSRRTVLKGAMAITAGTALAGCSSDDDSNSSALASQASASGPVANMPDLRETRKVYTTCPVECLTHSVNCQLVGDEVIRTEASTFNGDSHFTTACARGLARMQMLTEQRALTPMKRIKKGTATSPLGVVLKDNSVDQWQSISWEQAFNEIGAKMKELRAAQDNGIMIWTGSGNMGPIVNTLYGNFFGHINPNRALKLGNSCCQGVDDGMIPVFGDRRVDTRDTVRDSQCILCWGNSPADTSNTYWKYFAEARERGAKIITIDPRHNKTAAQSDQWIKLKAGTDTLFAIGMIREILRTAGAIDEMFLKHRTNAAFLVDYSSIADPAGTIVASDKKYNEIFNVKYYHVGGDETKAYIHDGTNIVEAEENKGRNTATTQTPDLYYHDGVNKITTAFNLMRALYAGDFALDTATGTLKANLEGLHDPYYVESKIVEVTGISSIDALKECVAAYVGTGKKSMIFQNMGGGQRTESAGGICALQCIIALITGNIGDAGNGVDDTSGWGTAYGTQTGDIAKPSATMRLNPAPGGTPHLIPFGELGRRLQLANNGQAMKGFHPNNNNNDPQMKLLYIATSNLLTQFPNTNALKEALRSTEMVVNAKPVWSTDAEYCDYFLPVTTPFEYEDIGAHSRNRYVQVMEAGVKPYGQAKSDMQILRGLAKIVFADSADASALANFDHDDAWYPNEIISNPDNKLADNGITNYDMLKEKKIIRPKVYEGTTGAFIPLHNHEFLGLQAAYRRAKIFITDWNQKVKKTLYANNRVYPYIDQAPNPARDLVRGPFPRYVPALNSHLEPLPDFTAIPQDYLDKRNKYKLCAVQYKTSNTVHGSFTHLSWIREAFSETPTIVMNTKDALARGIIDGDKVTVYNELGSLERVAVVTDGIMQGYVGLENGWWDKYGKSASTLAAELPDPLGNAHTHNNTLVEVRIGGI